MRAHLHDHSEAPTVDSRPFSSLRRKKIGSRLKGLVDFSSKVK